jgi:hypothetical protein
VISARSSVSGRCSSPSGGFGAVGGCDIHLPVVMTGGWRLVALLLVTRIQLAVLVSRRQLTRYYPMRWGGSARCVLPLGGTDGGCATAY